MNRLHLESASNAARTLCAAFVVVAWSCAPTRTAQQASGPTTGTSVSTQAKAVATAAPRIDRIEPDSVTQPRGRVVEVVILGNGFVPGQPGANTIDFSGMIISGVSANASGTEVRFVIPSTLVVGGEAPPMPVHPGAYGVRVKTAAGSSNMMNIWILE